MSQFFGESTAQSGADLLGTQRQGGVRFGRERRGLLSAGLVFIESQLRWKHQGKPRLQRVGLG